MPAVPQLHPSAVVNPPAHPDWEAAATVLMETCVALDSVEERLQVMDRICLVFGDLLYPTFLQLLCLVGRRGDEACRAAIAQALLHAMSTGRMPGGRLTAWGMRRAGTLHATSACRATTRPLGPVEYLCAWHLQKSGPTVLSRPAFATALSAVLELLNADGGARSLYCEMLRQDIEDPIVGSLARGTRQLLAFIGDTWARHVDAEAVVRLTLAEMGRMDAAPPSSRKGHARGPARL